MKKVFFTLLTISIQLFSMSTDFNEAARTWVARYGASASDTDLLKVADLMYYSLKRSECSLEAQQATYSALEELCHYSSSVVQTRLNPSKKTTHPFNKKTYASNQRLVINGLENYFKYNALYDATIQYVVHGDALQSALIKKGITELREEARSVVARALNEHIYSLQKSLSEAQKLVTNVAALFQNQTLPKLATRSFLEYVWACVPQFLINSFVTFDTTYKQTHEQLYKALLKEYEVGNTIWLVIESARGSWYRAHYTHILTLMQERKLVHAPS